MTELWDVLDEKGNKTGRLHERGKPLNKGEYQRQVYVGILNNKKQWLIAKRTPNKFPAPNMWEFVGGHVIAGDDSLTSALKEVCEELGIILEPRNGKLFKSYKWQRNGDDSGCFVDIWLFRQNIDISTITLCPNETCDAMWATSLDITRMIDEGVFKNWENITCLDELFAEVKND
ncbi:MAG: NUDIX domain-containing protein [Defluviitaleaceae bacterium]|nr:NUDIX domain-containing protein [Defluviitaleaceae bacterium]